MFTLAAIDIGTNTVRLLVVEAEDNSTNYRRLHHEQEIARLGEGLAEHGRLMPQAMERTLKVLTRYAEQAARFGADEIYAVATSAVREAKNGSELVEQVYEQTGIKIKIIPPEEEARLALLGVGSVIEARHRPILVIDIGGGSAEFIKADNHRIHDCLGLKVGVVKLTERFLKSDPVDKTKYWQMLSYINEILDPVKQITAGNPLLVGIAGTVTTLAAVAQNLSHYDPQLINNYVLKRERIRAIQDKFLQQPLKERRETPGLEPGRADVIVAGTAMLICFMERFGFDNVTACDSGLREGVVLNRLNNHFAGWLAYNPCNHKNNYCIID